MLSQLTVGHQVTPTMVPGYRQLFSWEWPSLLYALDIIAWDLFLGLPLLFAFHTRVHARWLPPS